MPGSRVRRKNFTPEFQGLSSALQIDQPEQSAARFITMFNIPRKRGVSRGGGHIPLLLLIVAASVWISGCVRHSDFYSQVIVEYSVPPGVDAKAAIQALVPKGEASVTVFQQRNTPLYQIGVYDRDPQKAADRANALAIAIRATLNDEASGRKFKIWQRAQPALYPGG